MVSKATRNLARFSSCATWLVNLPFFIKIATLTNAEESIILTIVYSDKWIISAILSITYAIAHQKFFYKKLQTFGGTNNENAMRPRYSAIAKKKTVGFFPFS